MSGFGLVAAITGPRRLAGLLWCGLLWCGLLWCGLLYLAAGAAEARGEVVRFEIHERSLLADGAHFGDVGPYERIVGTVEYAINPRHLVNQAIVDLEHAPRDSEGLVRFSADLFILAPKHLARGNRALLYDVNNRGNKLALRFFNDAPSGNDATDPGNGFLLRHGFTVVWSGWDAELVSGDSRLQLRAPIARGPQESIRGLVRYEICPDGESTRLPVNRAHHGAYRPTANGASAATVSWRLRSGDRRVSIPREQSRLHVREPGEDRQAQLPIVELELTAGFRRGYLYEVIYEARDPLVHGVCFAAVRDLISALRQGTGEQNPLLAKRQPVIQYAYGFGVSQSGRFLREFVHAGFNQDERHRQVFDGVIPHVAGAGLGSFNHRFAQPTAYSTQHQLQDWPSDRFPFTYATLTDPLSRETDGIQRRAVANGTAPKVFHTQSSAEYWTRGGSLAHTDPLGRRDAPVPDNVRFYTFGGTQHGPASYPPAAGIGQAPSNPGDYRPHLRALLLALDEWCRTGTSPPPSVYPRLADDTLAHWRQPTTGFPYLPGVRYPEVIHEPRLLGWGDRWQRERIIDQLPPRVRGDYRVLVPRCDADGNAMGCLLPPEVGVPLATFTGWNLRRYDAGAENELVGLNGSYFPFPASTAEANRAGDPRHSLEERYRSPENYLAQLDGYCAQLVRERYLLEEDVERVRRRMSERAAEAFAVRKTPGDADDP